MLNYFSKNKKRNKKSRALVYGYNIIYINGLFSYYTK